MNKRWMIAVCLLISMMLAGCRLSADRQSDERKYDGYIYYLNDEHTDLVREGFMFDSKRGQSLIDEISSRLAASADSKHESPLPDGVVIEKIVFEKNQVQVHLNTLFDKAGKTEQSLCRAALVLSYTQIPDIQGVLFFVDAEPMTDAAGNAYELQTADAYLYDPSIYPEASRKVSLTLYYGNKEGDKLKSESVTIETNGEQQMVQVIAEQLIGGPSFEEEIALIPQNTKVINAGIVGETAYLNLSDAMADTNVRVAPDICIYSIVNSIIENTDAVQVRIQIEGLSPTNYGGQIDLSQPLKAKKSLAE